MRTLLAVTLLITGLQAGQTVQPQKETSTMKITPLIYVQAIEPSLKFWVDQLSFTKTVEVPEGGKLGFVILMKGGAELMIQSANRPQFPYLPDAREFPAPTTCLAPAASAASRPAHP
jgi:hypothetical protein